VREPFLDQGRTRGYLQDDAEAMRRQVIDAHRAGWRVAAHAIGDRAVDLVLDFLEEAQHTAPRPDARHRVEHAGITDTDQVARMARLGVTPLPQHRFLYEIGDTMLDAVGPERSDRLYRHASMLAVGLRVPGSSDRPVVGGAPLAGMQSMVERRSSAGRLIGPDERVDAVTALRAYTMDTAWVAGDEHVRGRLSPGLLADLVLLGDDVTAVDSDRISRTEVLATLVGGEFTHGREVVAPG
jgi:predicted amidohydrolase YtcJ